MAHIKLYFVGESELQALDRGPITALDAAEMIAGPDSLNIYTAMTTIKSWQLDPVTDERPPG